MRRSAALAIVAVVVAWLFGSIPATASGQAPTLTGTHRVVVRPVDASGHLQPGFTVHRERGLRVTCDRSAPSAVDDGIYLCTPAAVYLLACWPSEHHTVLCLRDARNTKMLRLRYAGKLGRGKAPARPSPRALDLAAGQKCEERVFGSQWPTLRAHPHWVGFYACRSSYVYGPPSGDGIIRSTHPWTARVWRFGTRHVTIRPIATAYFVGTA